MTTNSVFDPIVTSSKATALDDPPELSEFAYDNEFPNLDDQTPEPEPP